MNDKERRKLFARLYNEDNKRSYGNFEYHMERIFCDTPIENKTVLEIGCGRGDLSLFLLVNKNPKSVVAVDECEGDGSDRDALDVLAQNAKLLKIENIEIAREDFNDDIERGLEYDIVIAKAAIHHIARSSNAYIFKNQDAHDQYIALFKKIRALLKPSGLFILIEGSRMSFRRVLRVKGIEWEIHPTLREFEYVLKKAGFRNIEMKYHVPHKLRMLEKMWNGVFAYFFGPVGYFYARNSEDI